MGCNFTHAFHRCNKPVIWFYMWKQTLNETNYKLLFSTNLLLIGDHCIVSEHFCTGQSWCKEGTCQCLDKKRIEAGRCVETALSKMLIAAERLLQHRFNVYRHHLARKPARRGNIDHQFAVVNGFLPSEHFLQNTPPVLNEKQGPKTGPFRPKKFLPIICGVDLGFILTEKDYMKPIN